MKSLWIGCATLILCGLGAVEQGEPAHPACNPDWHVQLLDKEGYFELGAELLYMTSSLSPTYTQTTLSSSPVVNFSVQTVDTGRVHPDYNIGFGVDLRFRPPTDNDVGFYYKYLKNTGDGKLVESDVVIQNRGAGNVFVTIDQDDKGSDEHHMHLADFLFGRTYPLSEQSVIRVAGGLSFYNMDYKVNYQDVDGFSEDATPQTTLQTIIAEQNNRAWGLGPKLGIDLEYYFLPRCWQHDFNMFLNLEFALFFSKEWSHGVQQFELEATTAGVFFETGNITNWKNQPGFEMTPNINLDMGLRYDFHSLRAYELGLVLGYRVLGFWFTEELFRLRSFQGGEDTNVLPDSNLIYAGPYGRLSLAF